MGNIDRVAEIALYPLKGARAATVGGEIPQVLDVGQTGFEVNNVRDRDWVLFDPNEGAFVSQRGWGAQGQRVRYPQDRQLATVEVDVCGDHVAMQSDIGRLELPVDPDEGVETELDIFGKQLPVLEQGKEAAGYFSRLLDRDVVLMRANRRRPRILPERYRRQDAFNQVAGADSMPFLLTSQASLMAAHRNNQMREGTVPISRYRGNIVIEGSGLGPFGEDYINGDVSFTVGDIAMWAVKACSRCPVPDIDQQTGERVGGGLRVLRGRAGSLPDGEKGVFFGQNLVHGSMGSVSVGDTVVVQSMRQLPNVLFRPPA